MLVMWAGAVGVVRGTGLDVAFGALTEWLTTSRDLYLGFSPWPTSWPFAVQVILAMFVMQFFDYWVHRALHHFPILWRIHGVHHHVSKMNVFMAQVAHPLEKAGVGLQIAGLFFLGLSTDVIVAMAVSFAVISYFNHSQVDVAFPRFLKWFVTSPRDHYVHHSLEDPNRNYGCNLIFWDRVFGTYTDGEQSPVERVGRGTGRSLSIVQMLVFPFRMPDRVEEPINWWWHREKQR
jgi:sterol desaturase/sphingolipid hydroxylase (fatty acid hydroxylase superfamily)